MTLRPQINWRDISPDQGITDIIEMSSERLMARYGTPSNLRVVISQAPNAQAHEAHIEIKLEMHLRGRDFLVTNESRSRAAAAPPEQAVKHAFDTLTHQVLKDQERRRQAGRWFGALVTKDPERRREVGRWFRDLEIEDHLAPRAVFPTAGE